MERRLAAILFADLVGFSRLMGEDEAGTLQRLKDLGLLDVGRTPVLLYLIAQLSSTGALDDTEGRLSRAEVYDRFFNDLQTEEAADYVAFDGQPFMDYLAARAGAD